MPSKAKKKTRGGDKDFADKNTFNPPAHPGKEGLNEPEQQDPKRRIGQYGGKGEPPIMKR
jgi:hypothetical protein